MPIICDPESEFEIVLETDKDKENPPTFIYRQLNTREFKRVGAVFDQMNHGQVSGIVEQIDIIMEAVTTGLLGWKNVFDRDGNEMAFQPMDLDLVLTPVEMSGDLMSKILISGQTTHEDKKKSESQVASVTD